MCLGMGFEYSEEYVEFLKVSVGICNDQKRSEKIILRVCNFIYKHDRKLC